MKMSLSSKSGQNKCLLFFSFLMVVVCGCHSPGASVLNVTRSIYPRFAKGFSIEVLSDSSKRIVLFNLDKPGDTLAVVPVPQQPWSRIACQSTTHLPYFNAIDRLGTVKGVGFASLVKNVEAKVRIASGEIKDLTAGDDISLEVLLSLQPDAFLVYPFGHSGYDKYVQAGIHCIPVSEYLEQHPLGRAEWLLFFGAMMHREKEAEAAFNRIAADYLNLSLKATQSKDWPVVFTGSSQSGEWHAPSGKSLISSFMKDAGVSYVMAFDTTSGNIHLSFEELYIVAQRCAGWGRVMFHPNPSALDLADGDERLLQTFPFQKGSLFYCDASSTDYFEDAVLKPDVQLKDLVKLFHPELLPDHQPVYFRPLK